MDTTLANDLGRVGIWTNALRPGSPSGGAEIADAARELDELGYGAIWLGGSPAVEDTFPLLKATSRLLVATGILSVWQHEPDEVAARFAEANAAHDGRFVLGLGVSHAPLTEGYRRPYTKMAAYLDALDAAETPVPAGRRVLAALGPRMLRLAAEHAGGAHPYLVTVDHTAAARETLGEGAALAPELKVVLDPDLTRARATARAYLSGYLELENYLNSLRRLGFTDDDFRGGGSDRLVHAVFALGDAEAVVPRVNAYLEAGADHVALQVVTENTGRDIPLPAYRTLATALGLSGDHG
ncbi:TIGR03620 family F420-dependent LLM class oxidoreductase [Streptomyces sp. SBT349]|uniref:TIGR03620 family F420-dependent LLM class oxidoreductase n=1 Tax=Streptomyces sp. SBT349 TaxID=1580539 RepID=UPI00066D16D7|nr:TIGR03620 family F420-dependent LLM class oxidoreductase [Streptomyces sp. SBT349]